jgi:hypothetical protein
MPSLWRQILFILVILVLEAIHFLLTASWLPWQ